MIDQNNLRRVSPGQILPSQDFLKEKTVRFILECLRTGNTEALPPTPLVREDAQGHLVAIDGHNLIAVRHHLHEPIEVIVAASSADGLPATSEANSIRNQELADKYDTVLDEQRRVAAAGISSFDALLEKYPELFAETAATGDAQKIDAYIHALPDWQQEICSRARKLIHEAEPRIEEVIKFTNRPYFVYEGNVCAFLAAKNHVNVFIYDPVAPDPDGIINQGQANQTARAIQITKDTFPSEKSFVNLIKAVAANNEKGGWRKLG